MNEFIWQWDKHCILWLSLYDMHACTQDPSFGLGVEKNWIMWQEGDEKECVHKNDPSFIITKLIIIFIILNLSLAHKYIPKRTSTSHIWACNNIFFIYFSFLWNIPLTKIHSSLMMLCPGLLSPLLSGLCIVYQNNVFVYSPQCSRSPPQPVTIKWKFIIQFFILLV